jgi:hypothetical protein
LLNQHHIRRIGLVPVRAAVLLSVVVMVCVPALTRIGQKLETASHAQSFSKNIDCPPKKVTVTPVSAVTSAIPLKTFETVRVAPLAPTPDAMLLRTPSPSAPPPLRAPPSALLA